MGDLVVQVLLAAIAVPLIGWLGNKVYRSIGHRINNAHATANAAAAACLKLAEQQREDTREVHALLRSHQEQDSRQFGEVLSILREQNGDLAYIRGKLEKH